MGSWIGSDGCSFMRVSNRVGGLLLRLANQEFCNVRSVFKNLVASSFAYRDLAGGVFPFALRVFAVGTFAPAFSPSATSPAAVPLCCLRSHCRPSRYGYIFAITLLVLAASSALTSRPAFAAEPDDGEREQREALLDDLYQQIGRLKVELEWLKKR